MQIHNISNNKKSKKRIGRGGKRGTYSGKGLKGQKSRSGRSLPRTATQVILKMPKLRGLKNKSKKSKPIILSLNDLEKLNLNHITKKTLAELGVIKHEKDAVKILSGGEIKKPLIVENLIVSIVAKSKIEKAGGSVS